MHFNNKIYEKYSIAHCGTDSSHAGIFALIATDKNDVNECHCFVTAKRKLVRKAEILMISQYSTI